jgi:hypothetical protein
MEAGRSHMDIFGLRTIFLMTDSQVAIDEALACEKDFPDICKDIKWRFISKKRWQGAEGGWENPFPSGKYNEELFSIQLEFALVQKCAFGIRGDSGYGL